MANPAKASLWQAMEWRRPMRSLGLLRRYGALASGPGQLSFGEMVKFGLVARDISLDEAKRFVGVRAQVAMHAACNDPGWFALSKNKLLWENHVKGAGFPVPETLAVYDRKGRGAGVPILANRDELLEFLLDDYNFPLFCKPTTGVYSIGALLLDKPDSGNIQVNGGGHQPLERVIDFIIGLAAKGYMLQRPIKMHRQFSAMDLTALPTLRILVFLTDEGSKIASVVLKLGGKGEVADNFWRPGALMGAVDANSGKITRMVGQVLGDAPVRDEWLEFQAPDYSAAVDLVTRASTHFPGISTQSWDVALGNDGPVLLELNHGGDLGLGQLAHGKGILTPQYCAHLRAYNYAGKLPD